MSRPFEVRHPQDKIARRRVLFALELLDGATLERVSSGMKEVKAHGLHGKPTVNVSGLFVWLDEDIEPLQKISIDPGALPYEEVELKADQLELLRESVRQLKVWREKVEPDADQPKLPLVSIDLPPRVDYPFDSGLTGLRGTLVEDLDRPYKSVPEADVYLRWLDEDGNWHDAPTRSHTTPAKSAPPAKGGDFAAILRLAPSEVPQLDADGKLTVRLRVIRDNEERGPADLKVLQGRVENPSTPNQFVFAWDELEP